ncbi:hypothetical protein N0V90_001620 [Kalmusia sp. IMI 367209]|nr:hypothetical protein N0V90_001620 [Kalmusia sp. IMI 367209]
MSREEPKLKDPVVNHSPVGARPTSAMQRKSRQRTAPIEPSKVILDFLENYNPSHYYQVAKCARDLIEKELKKWPDLHVYVHFRAKKEKSLKEKLRMRDAECRYQDVEDIWRDIHDLAGVRIILYTPSESQREEVEKVIKAIWADVQRKDHDGSDDRTKSMVNAGIQTTKEHQAKAKYRRKHPGYTARHYRVKMEKVQERGNYSHKPRDRVEIQVVSALSHAWAEAGHDILYKSHEYGIPSAQEEMLLDSLNGLVMSGDILLEQFYGLVAKRTTATFQHHYDFGIFLRELDILQPQEQGDERIEFDDAGLQVLLRFLVKTDRDRPNQVRDAFKELGFPHEGTLDLYLKDNISPIFQPAPGMLAIICLFHHMLPPRSQDRIEEVPTRRQCYIMVNALLLLQTFFGNSELTNKFLQETVEITEDQRKSLHFMITDTRRQLVLEEKPRDLDYKAYEERIQGDMESAWEWFNQEACNKASICGIAFRLAQMGATKDVEWTALLGRLTIGPILSRTPTSSVEGSVEGSVDGSVDDGVEGKMTESGTIG